MTRVISLALIGCVTCLAGPVLSEAEAVAVIQSLKGTVNRDLNRPGHPVVGINL